MHNNTKTTTFSVKKGHTFTTTLKQQHLVSHKTRSTTFIKKAHTYTTLKQQHLL